MPDIALKSPAGLKPLDPGLSPEVLDWVSALRTIWNVTGLSMNRFAQLHPVIDKGTISRYLNGQRVPGDHWFLDTLLAIQATNDKLVTPAVREHLTSLQLRALQAAHPHEYRVRRVRDELEIAQTGQVEAERYAHALEEQLAERKRRIQELIDNTGLLRAAWDADRVAMQAEYERLTREIDKITRQLHLAQKRAARAERRCQTLEDVLDQLGTYISTDNEDNTDRWFPREVLTAEHPPSAVASSVRTLILGLDYDGRIVTHDRNAVQILARRPEDLLGAQLIELTPAGQAGNSRDAMLGDAAAAAVARLLEAVCSDREDSAMLTIWTQNGHLAEAVVTVHPMRAGGTTLAAQALLRIPAPNYERFIDPALMRRQMVNDTFTRIAAFDGDPLARELMDALVPHFCNIADLLLLEGLVGEDEFPAHGPEGSAPLRRIALRYERMDPAWEAAFPTGEILRYPPDTPYYQCMDTGKPVFETTISKAQAGKIAEALRRKPVAKLLSGASMLMLPLIARNNMLGFFACTRQEGFRRFDAYDAEIGLEFVSRAAVLIDGRWSKHGSIVANDHAIARILSELPDS